jgi:hypothetical protein
VLTETLRHLLDGCSRNGDDTAALLVAADCAQESEEASLEYGLRFLASLDAEDRCPTGSRVYGRPTPESDWDWVFRGPPVALTQFHKRADKATTNDEYDRDLLLQGAYRFGPLNLIWSPDGMFHHWRDGTDELIIERVVHGPVTRDRAVEVFKRRAYGKV